MTFPLYSKINSIQKRHTEGPLRGQFTGEWAIPEFGYLSENEWIWREKVDGTNIRVGVRIPEGQQYLTIEIGGRTASAQIPAPLYQRLHDTFYIDDEVYREAFDEECLRDGVTLFGEGYGAGIQKGGNYGPVDFILFDVRIGDSWMTEESTTDIAGKLGLKRVPIVGFGTLNEAIKTVAGGLLESAWAGVKAEGLVCVPSVPLFDRRGHRIITKVKDKDFK
jgi:hypothetical protein